MEAHLLARNARDCDIDRRYQLLADGHELRLRLVLEDDVAVHGEIGGVDLQDKAGLMDRQILVAHLPGERQHVVLVRRIVGVEQRARDDAG